MRAALVSFTANGFATEKRLVRLLTEAGHEARPYVMGKYALQAAARDTEICFCAVKEGGLSAWAGVQFEEMDALVFVGACGIAVRALAPFIKDKRTDPAVVVVDEKGSFVIPILSGHLGGANDLALLLAGGLEAMPVITTATDINGRFSVDSFAKIRGLTLANSETAKLVSADILAGEPVGVFSDFAIDGPVPDGLRTDTMCRHNIWITISQRNRPETGNVRILKLIPRCVALGIGCRRGTPAARIREIIREAMEQGHVAAESICAVASIDLKSGEPGLCETAKELGVPFFTYTREELSAISGEFSDSEFVKQTVGVGNVCERAAVAACLEAAKTGRLLFGKYAKDGVTVAAACFTPQLFAAEGG
ncbi:MAG: cobalt-precorrin 5A hydrolase [Lachnospiraceae bacterium]|nr:cobalt-precorrin 5A hydrolase [Lachnospiraceae bacterium]NBJ81003.1 cobalamin biosynthesis protein CbiG [bacterium 1XD42-76]NBK04212.1 cobalamin biosynthesis protein CbiG [bacterium 1XD42-94]